MEPCGCWLAYNTDHSGHWSTTVFADELSARRYAMKNMLEVIFTQWGTSLGDSVDQERDTNAIPQRETTPISMDG